jgi:ribosome-binding protein aMBF1 (putative translation factor)
VVADDEAPPPPAKPKTVTEAADKGTTRELLVAMRARIATAVEDPNTPARDLAALTKRLVEVVRDIEAIDAREKQDGASGAEVEDGRFDASAV